jgi:putative membrane protein
MPDSGDTVTDGKTRSTSYVRDQLANERTFLAWLRTAVAMMGFGVVIVKLRYLVPQAPHAQGPLNALHLGLLFAVVGFAMVPFALWHFFATRRSIDDDNYGPQAASTVISVSRLC